MAGPKRRAFRSRLLLGALRGIGFVARRLSLRSAQRIGGAIGTVATWVDRRDVRKAIENLAIAFPDWSKVERRRVVRNMFRHLGMTLLEMVWLPNLPVTDPRTTVEGMEPVIDHVRNGGSVVAFTGHCGNWEWLAYVVGQRVPTTVLQRDRSEPGASEFIAGIRKGANIETIDRGSAASGRELIRAMRKPGLIGFLIDQSIRAESAKVPFFDKPALTPIGPATLAIRTEALAVATFIERHRDGTHLIRFLDPIQTKRGDDPIALTARMTRSIEDQIRRAPEQWVWMHDRWRDRPKWDVATRKRGAG